MTSGGTERRTPELGDFNVRNVPARLKNLKKDPWAEFFKVRQTVTNPMQLERTPSTIARAAPRRGEHTEEVLLELGLSPDDLARMKATGVY